MFTVRTRKQKIVDFVQYTLMVVGGIILTLLVIYALTPMN